MLHEKSNIDQSLSVEFQSTSAISADIVQSFLIQMLLFLIQIFTILLILAIE